MSTLSNSQFTSKTPEQSSEFSMIRFFYFDMMPQYSPVGSNHGKLNKIENKTHHCSSTINFDSINLSVSRHVEL